PPFSRSARHRPKVQGGAWCTNLTLCRAKRTRVGGVLSGVSQRKSSSRVIWPLLNSVHSLEHRFGTMPSARNPVSRNPGRVDLGGCPPKSPTDPGLHITRTQFLIS